GGHFGPDLIIFQQYAVVTGRGLFGFMPEPGPVSCIRILLGARFGLPFPDRGHYQDITQVRPARTAQVQVRKAHDGTVRTVVARAPVPAFNARIGTQLYHSKRQGGSGKGMAVFGGPDKGIYIGNQALPIAKSAEAANNKG